VNLRWLFQTNKQKEISNLEARLDSAFRPVGPRPEFVRRLRVELLPPARKRLLGLADGGWQAALLIGAAALSGLVLVQNGVRLVLSLMGALGLAHQARKSAREQSGFPFKPTP
jgi:hypothetical protein